jgi:serine protease Do
MGGAAVAQVNQGDHHAADKNPPATLKLANANEGPVKSTFAPIVKETLPAVVNISSSKVVKTPRADERNQMDPLFQQFFGGRNGQLNVPKERREQSLGSGVIVSPEGYILTNNHVVDGATDVRVTLGDKREFKARIVGTDAKTDVAILKIDASNLPVITIGDSSKVQVGDTALAMGDPFGVGQTVTQGIISAKGRGGLGIEEYEDFIQTDAPINPGNSGGALINERGELIGINTAIVTGGGSSEGSHGIGFAVPVNLARSVMDQILKNGKVTRAYLGVMAQDVTPAMAKSFGAKGMTGALVGDVSADGPAQKAGVEKGDIILDVNGKPVVDGNSLRNTISMMTPDTTVKLRLLRNGSERDLTVKLAEFPDKEEQAQLEKSGDDAAQGISVQNLDAQTRHQAGVSAETAGVVVTDVSPASQAAASGLRSGDVIQEVNRKPVTNASEFKLAMTKAGDAPVLLVNRHGTTMYLAV